MRRLIPLSALLLLCGVARADRWELADGETVSGAAIGSAAGRLLVLTPEGERSLEAGAVVRHQPEEVERDLQRKADKARAAWVARGEREARALLRRHARARDAAGREEAAAGLDQLGPLALLTPLAGALDETDEPTRQLALARLSALPHPEATDALLRAAMELKRPTQRAEAHQAAAGRDPLRAREVYEAVLASPTRPSRRAYALQHLDAMAQRSSIPGLIVAVEKIKMESRAALATGGSLRQVPVNLGSTGAAATQVPIELPEMQMIEVQSSNTVMVLRVLEDGAQRLLRKLSGVDKGDDPAAWRRWWDAEGSRQGGSAGR